MPTRTPLYRDVKQRIVELLRAGRWKHGERVASEPQLARRFGCSVGTIRHAVGELVAENVLVREQGRGTFVRSHTADHMLDAFFRIVGHDGSHVLPTVRMLRLQRRRADRQVARQLRLPPRAPVIAIDTLLSLNGKLSILDRMHLPRALFPDLDEAAFARRDGTVYAFFQQQYGITVVRAEEFVTAVIATEADAVLLEVPAGTPLLRIQRTAYTYRDQPVDSRVRLVRCDGHGYLGLLGSQR